jgi:hypothetical protein
MVARGAERRQDAERGENGERAAVRHRSAAGAMVRRVLRERLDTS